MLKKMKSLLVIFVTIFLCGCQAVHQPMEAGHEAPKYSDGLVVIDIDPFYSWGKYPKVRLSGVEAQKFQSIIESSPVIKPPSIPEGVTVSPAPGLSIIEIGEDGYHIMRDCEILTRRVTFENRVKLFNILSRHTNQFIKPKA